jgi:hypothetical protein
MMRSHSSVLALAFMSRLPCTLAWGNLGHETIAYIATNFGMKASVNFHGVKTDEHAVTSATTTFFQDILGDTSGDYLANVATYVSPPVTLWESGRLND